MCVRRGGRGEGGRRKGGEKGARVGVGECVCVWRQRWTGREEEGRTGERDKGRRGGGVGRGVGCGVDWIRVVEWGGGGLGWGGGGGGRVGWG